MDAAVIRDVADDGAKEPPNLPAVLPAAMDSFKDKYLK
jgi:hypothetical protein